MNRFRFRWTMTFCCFFLTAHLLCAESVNSGYCFEKLNENEQHQKWADEYQMGIAFAEQKEYHEAIYCFKRALISMPNLIQRAHEVQYAIILSHYLNRNYAEVISFFETHSIIHADASFAAFVDLLRILHFSYGSIKQFEKAKIVESRLLNIKETNQREVKLISALLSQDLQAVQSHSKALSQDSFAQTLTESYVKKRKSNKLAKGLNLVVPGLGYLYVGQKKAALCAFILNSALIFGTVQLFTGHFYTLGALVALFELGWYAGGVIGIDRAVDLYNDTIFTQYKDKMLSKHHLEPEEVIGYEF